MPATTNQWTEQQITEGLMALIAWAGNATAAARYLSKEKGWTINAQTLSHWKQTHGPRYSEMRDKYRETAEKHLEGEIRDVAILATSVERLALERASQLLYENNDRDPGRTAANAARVKQSSVDKLMTLTGRPTQITESRGLPEILRSLAAKGVIALPEAPEEKK